jgi:branched-chain amino acid aminotransferase
MLSDRTVYLNGEFLDWERATVPIMSHSFARGSAIFEVMSFHETDEGPAIFRLDEHLHRLFRTAELLSMELPLTKEALAEAVRATVKTNNLTSGAIKLVAYYRDIAFEVLSSQKTLDVCIVAIDPALDLGGFSYEKPEGLSACISRWRKLHPETVPVEAKVAANYLNGMMARLDCEKRGFDMAIMVDTEGFVAEGSTESVFFVNDGVLTTSALGTVLQSITRKSLLEAAQVMGIQTAERRMRPEAVMEAEEIFFSCSPQKIAPVKKIEDRTIHTVPGPVTRKLISALDDICSGKNPRFRDWLFPVK